MEVEIEKYKTGQIQSRQTKQNGILSSFNDQPAVEIYFENGQIKRQEWKNDGEFNRESGPAVIEFDQDGLISCKEWYKFGRPHRAEHLPHVEYFYKNGHIKSQWWFSSFSSPFGYQDIIAHIIYWHENGAKNIEVWSVQNYFHRDDYPAVIQYSPDLPLNPKISESWYYHGILHRIDGPAYVEYYSSGRIKLEEWYHLGRSSRPGKSNLPTKIGYYDLPDSPKLAEFWCSEGGQHHREDGPAIICYKPNGRKKTEIWKKHGQLYRNDHLPTVINY